MSQPNTNRLTTPHYAKVCTHPGFITLGLDSLAYVQYSPELGLWDIFEANGEKMASSTSYAGACMIAMREDLDPLSVH